MKTKRIFYPIYLLMALTSVWSCSSNDDSDDGDNPPGSNYIHYTISGSAASGLNDVFNIDYPDNDTQGATTVFGHVVNESTDEGTVKVVNLTFSYFVSDDDYHDVTLRLPAVTGSSPLGTFETSPSGMITEEPTYSMVLDFDSNRALYDHDNDGDNDILTALLSNNVVVTITEYEETTNSLGIPTVAHIKGSIGGSGNQFLFKYFTSPTSPAGDSFCSVTADFEYTLID